MKNSLSLLLLFGTLTVATAQTLTTSNLYVEDWGSIKHPGSLSLSQVGWTPVLPPGASGGGPYSGIFSAPPNCVYFEDMAPGQFGIFYTTDSSGAGADGDSSFTDIDPTVFTNNLTFTIAREGTFASNYFAIQEGGSWYVSTNLLPSGSSYPNFLPVSMPYTNLASSWKTLTINAPGSGVTIGSTPAQNLSGLITGVGMVVDASFSGWDYSTLTISASVPLPPPSQVLYSEDWGAAFTAGGGAAPTTLAEVGWTGLGIAYTGIFGVAAGTLDVTTGVTASTRAMYESADTANAVGIVYTTDTSGNGGQGDSSFSDIDPSLYPSGVTFNLESEASGNPVFPPAYVTNYLAVQVGGAWYVSVNPFTNNSPSVPGDAVWTQNSFLYTNNNAAANWNSLTLGASSASIGGPASAPLSGPIQGIGIVAATGTFSTTSTGYGIDQNLLTITAALTIPAGNVAPKIDAPGFSQTAFATGTASFAVDAYVGTPTLNYTWTFDPAAGGAPVTLANGATGTGSFIIGAGSNLLTIVNLSSADAGTYSVEVSNLYGQDYSTNYTTNTLTVNPLTNNILYAETFPFAGPLPTAGSLTNIGWRSTTAGDIPDRLDETGAAYAYETGAKTSAFYAATNTDVAGLSGVPFTAITPANYPFVSFRATIAAQANAGNVSMYWAVQMGGSSWYVSTSAIQLGATPAAYTTYGLQFDPTASGWNTLTLSSSSATIGSAASANLAGNITGAGVVFVFTGLALYSLDSFMLVTNSTPPIPPSFPSEPNVPYPQTVYAGSGVGFSFTEAGTLPFTNSWELNDSPGVFQSGTLLVNGTNSDGSIITGATNRAIFIQNVQSGEAGVYSGWAVNAGGTNSTDSGTDGSPILTVTPPPLGLIYNESFPVYSLPAGNLNLTNVGWTLQADTPARIFKLNGTAPDVQSGTSAAYAYEGGFTNAVLYASTTSDTGYSGLPFIAFDPADYPANSIQFSTSMAQGDGAWTNVTASFAVQQGGQWYAMATPLITASFTPAIALLAPGSIAANYTLLGPQTYSPAASQWKSLTFVGAQGVVLGGTPAQNLSGPITAAGLLFQYFGAGGSINFNSFNIQATGAGNLVGSLNIGPLINGTVTLTWIGNPAVNLQSASSLTSTFADISSTLGQHSYTVNVSGVQQQYYRLVKH
jgi:hypothetical protein